MCPKPTIHERLSKHILADGMPMVYDLEKSQGNTFVDSLSGESYLDVFAFFASGALGHNHPAFKEPKVQQDLLQAACVKPSLADVYTEEYARFVETVAQITPAPFVYHFFIEGGALAVENALKAAFDWKVRKNLKNGHGEKGSQIIHFTEAFHGRSGYTLSLTNTHSKVKTQYFPQFRWPRIPSPAMTFPCHGNHLEKTIVEEKLALEAIKQALVDNPQDIAAIIIEPIQSEGGDRHFRREFFQALRDLTYEEEILLIFDEVQTGMGLTGKWWCHEHFDITPDIFAFAKKMQVGGIAATRRLDEIDGVFKVSSRINSTFGGNLTDMVRARVIINTMLSENLVTRAAHEGEILMQALGEWSQKHSEYISNLRGRGLMIAFDFLNTATRDRFVQLAFEHGILLLGCGEKSVRLRPYLIFDESSRHLLMSCFEKIMINF